MRESVSVFEWGIFRLQTRAELFASEGIDVRKQFVTWGAVSTFPQSATWMVQTAVPEPSAIVLVLTDIGLLVWTDRQRRTRQV